jgi:succinate dehydrogenase / fumarate reductase membrane anchor subunit
MAAYLVFFLFRLSAQAPHGFFQWRGFMTSPLMSISTLLLFGFLLIHAWVGMRDVAMDYLHSFRIRITMLSLIAAGLIAMGAWLLLVLARAI